MELILNELLTDDLTLTSKQRENCLSVLENSLQHNTKDYAAYFSSNPTPGSIVEEIAEVDAQISSIEREIKSLLIDNKSTVIEDILNDKNANDLSSIKNQLFLLKQINGNKDSGSQVTDSPKLNSDNIFIEEFLAIENDEDGKVRGKKQDEFQEVLNKLRLRKSQSQNDGKSNSADLSLVLKNLDGVTDLMELPFLARTCIRTGHYQEAIMLYTHSKSLLVRFPGSSTVQNICDKILSEITTTMLTGLVMLLSTNVTVNSLKKILKYLSSIPPFDDKTNTSSLLQVFLSMRYLFIQSEISSYSLDVDPPNDSLIEMMVKRKIEVLREHTYNSLNVFVTTFQSAGKPLLVPLEIGLNSEEETLTYKDNETSSNETEETSASSNEDKPTLQNEIPSSLSKTEVTVSNENGDTTLDESEVNNAIETEKTESHDKVETATETHESDLNKHTNDTTTFDPEHVNTEQQDPVETNPLMLQFLKNCVAYLLKELTDANLQNKLSDSVCLQLIYCSFRLRDLNTNYHNIFLNHLVETHLFPKSQVANAITKRTQLTSRYAQSFQSSQTGTNKTSGIDSPTQ